ncbi:MAG: hypothetical protein ABSE05_00130 [Syntrophales bacterium]|jgi:protein-disulfide isomerase
MDWDWSPTVGGMLPDITLSAPRDSADKNYLGLSGFGSFKIPHIRAKVVIVEIFNMYCPYRQREASNVNELYANIDQNPAQGCYQDHWHWQQQYIL